MKKIGINFQDFSLISAFSAVAKNFPLAFIFPNRSIHSSLIVINNHFKIKTGVFSIQLPK